MLRAGDGTQYEAEPAAIIGHDLYDEVTPYHVRIDADGETFMCTPHEVARD